MVAGTGTEVGKTYITAALLRTLTPRVRAVGLKPVESGCEGGVAADAAELSRACGIDMKPCYAFRDPVSPHMASESEQRPILLDSVFEWVVTSERASAASVSVIETAGGLCSPLAVRDAEALTNLDLLMRLEPQFWILVAPDRLGVLHDVEVARAAARSKYRTPDAIVLTQALRPQSETAWLRNAAELRRWCREPVILSGEGLSKLAEVLSVRAGL